MQHKNFSSSNPFSFKNLFTPLIVTESHTKRPIRTKFHHGTSTTAFLCQLQRHQSRKQTNFTRFTRPIVRLRTFSGVGFVVLKLCVGSVIP